MRERLTSGSGMHLPAVKRLSMKSKSLKTGTGESNRIDLRDGNDSFTVKKRFNDSPKQSKDNFKQRESVFRMNSCLKLLLQRVVHH